MKLYTTDYISDKKIETLGLVVGSTIQTVHAGKDFGAGLKNLFGGELTAYTEMMDKARDIAINRMIAKAEAEGAQAIVGVRFTSAEVTQAAAEVIVYGTAVKILD